jgi:haloalkane dehalogenase
MHVTSRRDSSACATSADAHDDPTAAAPDRAILGLRLRTVSLASGHISYVDEGVGPVVLLLHGAPVTSLGFLRVIRELQSNYRVIAPDFPGFGLSTASPAFSGRLAEYATFIGDFCHALDLRHFYAYLNDSSACMAFPALARLDDRLSGFVVASTVPLPLTGRSRLVGYVLRYVVGSAIAQRLNRRLNLLPWLVATVAPWLKPFSRSERIALRAQFDTVEKRDRIIDIFRQMGSNDAFMQMSADAARTRLAETPTLILYGQFDPMRWVGGVSRFTLMFRRHTVRIIPLEEHFPILASGARVGRFVHEWIRTLG